MMLAVNPSLAHRRSCAPGKKRLALDVWIVREQACYKLRSRSFESIRTWSFDRYRFAEARSVRKASFHSLTGERYIYVNETLCWKPRFPNHQPGAAATVCPGWHGSISERRGRPRHRTFTRVRLRRNVH